jgi:hypothetical protein
LRCMYEVSEFLQLELFFQRDFQVYCDILIAVWRVFFSKIKEELPRSSSSTYSYDISSSLEYSWFLFDSRASFSAWSS